MSTKANGQIETQYGSPLTKVKKRESGLKLMIRMVFSLCLCKSFGESFQILLLPRSMMTLLTFTNPSKIAINREFTLEYRLKSKDFIHCK